MEYRAAVRSLARSITPFIPVNVLVTPDRRLFSPQRESGNGKAEVGRSELENGLLDVLVVLWPFLWLRGNKTLLLAFFSI